MSFMVNASPHKIICTFLLSRNNFNMGIGEEKVKVDRDVCSKVFQDCFLLTEIMQMYFLLLFLTSIFSQKVPQLSLSVPFREDSHASCAQDV